MTESQVLDLIQQAIVANDNNEITANVLRPILEEMLKQPNELIGYLDDLQTNNKDDLVSAINEIITNSGSDFTILQGATDPNVTPPTSYNLGDFYARYNPNLDSFYQFNGVNWVEIKDANQFTDPQADALLDLIYSNHVIGLSVSPSSGERGLATTISLNRIINANDDTITSASINQGIGAVTLTNGSTSVPDLVQSITFTLSVGFTKNGVGGTDTRSATYTAIIPQWAGWATNTDFTTYAQINGAANLQKFIQSSPSINKEVTLTSGYVWFISNKSNAVIKNQNDFTLTIGAWNAPTEFWKKEITLTLADGVTTSKVWLYRKRESQALTNFTYKIS